ATSDAWASDKTSERRMRGLCGWFSSRGEDNADATLRQMLSGHPEPVMEARTQVVGPTTGLAVFGTVARPQLVDMDGIVLAIAGHPRVRSENPAGDALQSLARLIGERGSAAFASIGGDFAIAAWDRQRQRGLLAVDRIGAHQLVYAPTPGGIAFGSTLDLLG